MSGWQRAGAGGRAGGSELGLVICKEKPRADGQLTGHPEGQLTAVGREVRGLSGVGRGRLGTASRFLIHLSFPVWWWL